MPANVSIVITAKDQASGVLKGIAGTLGNIAKVAGAVALAGGAALVGFLSSSVKEASEAENALAQLNAVLQSTGGAAGISAKELIDYADSASMVTRFSDEAVISAQSMLLTFTSIGKDVFPAATSTVLDMSQALGQDLQSSAIQLGKALNDPIQGITALRRVGVQFTDDQEKVIKKLVESGDLMEAQKLILEELQVEFGGSAEAAGETFAGRVDILKNKLSNLQEGIGQALMPSLLRLADVFTDIFYDPRVLDFIEKFSTGIAAAAEGILDILTGAKKLDLSDMTAGFADWAKSIDWKGLSQGLAEGIKSVDWVAVGDEIRTSAINIFNGISTIVSEIDWKALSDALGGALAGVVAGLYGYISWDALKTDFNNGFASLFGYDTSTAFADLQTDFREGFLLIGQVIGESILVITNGTITKFNELKDKIVGAIISIKNAVTDKAKDLMKGIIDGINNGIGGVIAAVKKLVNQINAILANIISPDILGGGGGNKGGGNKSASNLGGASAGGGASPSGGNNGVPQFAGGGVMNAPVTGGLALLHGTEGVFTREQMAMLSPSGGGVTINLTYAPAFSTASANEVENALMPFILRGIYKSRRGK